MAAVCELNAAELAQVEGGLVYNFTDVLVSGHSAPSSFQWGIGR
jgi:bacteriocin-like protein